MILFGQDYLHNNKIHIDTTTTNKSFIRMHHVLRKMGIKNNKYFLTLLDRDLIGVDPYNLKDTSHELKLRIARECKLNPWYFYREMVLIPVVGSPGIKFQLNRANLSVIWLFSNHIDTLLVMPRQLGKTIGSVTIAVLILYVTGINTVFSMLAKDDKLRKENVSRLKDIRDNLPGWFIDKNAADVENSEEIKYNALNNKYLTYVAQSSVAGAEKLGRGMTTPCQHWDELAYFANLEITYPVAISSTNAAIEMAKKFNQPYGNLLTTTAGKLNTKEGRFTHSLLCDSLIFGESLYDLADMEHLHKTVRANSPQGMIYCEFSFLQLGKTQEWFEETAARTKGGDDIINRDLLNIWTFGTAGSPIDKNLLKKMYEHKQEVVYTQMIDEFMVKWYIPKEVVHGPEFKEIPILLGMDASENVGRDFTSFVFTDARDLKVIGTAVCNTVNIIKVALFVMRWLVYKNILFVPERNSVGCAIIDYCLLKLDEKGIYAYTRIYNEAVQANKPVSDLIDLHNTKRNSFGFRTSSKTRNFLYKTVFFKALETSSDKISDAQLINEIAGLVIKNGRVDHSTGNHDDLVIAFILTAYVAFFGDNLRHYSFVKNDPSIVLDALHTTEDGLDLDKIQEMQSRIDNLDSQVKVTSNPTIKIGMIHESNQLKKHIPSELPIQNIHSVAQLKVKKPLGNNPTGSITNFLQGF